MTDLEIYQHNGAAVAVPVPHDIDSWTQVAAKVIKLAEEIYDTPFVPEGLRGSVPATAAAILAGRELGLGPMTSLANIHVIKGKPALAAGLMRALILAQGHQIETVDISDTRCLVRGRRKGEATWEEAGFTADQAKRARIELGGYPQDKLYARATSRLARRKFADVIAGMPYSAEELEDGDPGASAAPAIEAPENGAQPRTARRGRAPQNVPPADAVPPQHAGPATPPAGRTAGGTPLPPLPGEEDPTDAPGATGSEATTGPAPGAATAASPAQTDGSHRGTSGDGGEPDDTDYDTPGTVTKAQLTRLGATFTDLGFTSREREQRLVAASQITGRELTSSSELSKSEAATLIDTLARCEGDREKLIAVLAAGESHA